MAGRIALIACGVFAPELRIIDRELRAQFEPLCIDSLLHLDPVELDRRIRDSLPADGSPAILLYGDCSPFVIERGSGPGRARTRGSNCSEIMLGSERYRELRRAGAFFVLPEWVDRWEDIFKVKLGFKDAELARSLMADTMKRVVYLDTGSLDPPLDTLKAISEYLGLPLEVEYTGVAHLEASLKASLKASLEASLEAGSVRGTR
ncbi:MAG: DUF1638 domain-containing protein [Spirochaetales bacterium]|nr:DUF1638 domain-containing protein [Spirochaetales bacterium]